jgi:cobalt-zinc-cadmium efflux system protein
MGAGHTHGPGPAHSHGSGHTHGHGHNHASPSTARTRLAIAFAITALIVLAQAVGSVLTGSLALLTDTAHALVDASGLLVALIAATMVLRPASSTRSSCSPAARTRAST